MESIKGVPAAGEIKREAWPKAAIVRATAPTLTGCWGSTKAIATLNREEVNRGEGTESVIDDGFAAFSTEGVQMV